MDIDLEWARCGFWIKSALNQVGVHTLAEARSEVEAGKAMFWPGKHSAGLSEPVRDMHIWAAGGDLRELIEMERAVCDWSRREGFSRVTIDGRKGWERVFPNYRTMLVKDL